MQIILFCFYYISLQCYKCLKPNGNYVDNPIYNSFDDNVYFNEGLWLLANIKLKATVKYTVAFISIR
jgi:hypothetical protein